MLKNFVFGLNVVFTFLTSTLGLVCYDCSDIKDPAVCFKTTDCGRDKLCFTHEFETNTGFETRYRLTCQSQLICEALNHTTYNNICNHCCDTDKCNGQLCQAKNTHPPTHPTTTRSTRPSTTTTTTTRATTLAYRAPSVHVHNTHVDIAYGTNAIINCQVSGNPEPLITWSFNGGYLPSNAYSVAQGHALVIDNVEAYHKGTYTCKAVNLLGQKSVDVTVTVTNVPTSTTMTTHPTTHRTTTTTRPTTPTTTTTPATTPAYKVPSVHIQNTHMNVTYGREAIINCQVSGNPEPKITWSFNGGYLPSNAYTVGPGNALVIVNAEAYHSGTYTCKAVNLLGQKSVDVTVTVTDVPVNGAWGHWSNWDSCTVTCGTGSKTRHRSCDHPAPSNGGLTCSGSDKDTATCHPGHCIVPIDGAWGTWSVWSQCSVTCGTGYRTRARSCDNPAPSNGGSSCSGQSLDAGRCTIAQCVVDGAWSGWSMWSQCSVSCGSGQSTRFRSCTHPAPSHGGSSCAGSRQETKACSHSCKVDGGWTSWSAFTSCSVTCGRGYITRHRNCNNPRPANGGSNCQGHRSDFKICSSRHCPVDGHWSLWLSWTSCSATCNTGSRSRNRTCSNPAPSYGGSNCIGQDREQGSCSNGPCPVPSPITPTAHVQSTTAVSVLTTKRPKLTVKEQELVWHGDNISIPCSAPGNTGSYHLAWTMLLGTVASNVQSHGSSLEIYEAKPYNEGIYECMATDGRTDIHAYTHVIVYGTKAVIMKGPGYVTVTEGDIAQLHCVAAGHPSPNTTWEFHNGAIEDVNQHHRVYVTKDHVTVVIKSVKMADGGTYKCTATNFYGSVTSYGFLNVTQKPTVSPPTTLKPEPARAFLPTHEIVLHDSDTTLHCNVTGQPNPFVVWYFNNSIQLPSNVNRHGNDLIIQHATLKNKGFYKCSARNSYGQDEKELSMDIFGLPPLITRTPRSQTPTIGDTVVIACDASGIPRPTIYWTFTSSSGSTRVWPSYIRLLSSNTTLLITDVTNQHNGRFICISENGYGTDVAGANITVHATGSSVIGK